MQLLVGAQPQLSRGSFAELWWEKDVSICLTAGANQVCGKIWIGPKAGMHWPAVDEDLSIEYLVAKGELCKQASEITFESA